MNKLLTFIMAGGKGERLYPLIKERAKPAVPFGGAYRIIDFTLSNCINSGLRKIHVLTQYKSHSLNRHLRMGWGIFNAELGEYVDVIPAQQRVGSDWYKGTADAIYQNIFTIQDESPEMVLILAGDHVYKMNYAKMIDYHLKMEADVTIGVVEVQRQSISQLGVIMFDSSGEVVKFIEKPQDEMMIEQSKNSIFASMGIYLFKRGILEEELNIDAASEESDHDFGRNIIPNMIAKRRRILAFNLKAGSPDGKPYWRDIGTLEAYYEANMDLLSIEPQFNLYDKDWPIRSYQEPHPPAKTVFAGDILTGRIGLALESLICAGCIVSGGKVQHSILSPAVRINSYSEVFDSILMDGVNVGRYARIKRAIVDKYVNIPQGTVIGFDAAEDKKRFFVSEGGVVIVAKGTLID